MRKQAFRNNQKAIALAAALSLILVMSLMVVGLVFNSQNELKEKESVVRQSEAMHKARSQFSFLKSVFQRRLEAWVHDGSAPQIPIGNGSDRFRLREYVERPVEFEPEEQISYRIQCLSEGTPAISPCDNERPLQSENQNFDNYTGIGDPNGLSGQTYNLLPKRYRVKFQKVIDGSTVVIQQTWVVSPISLRDYSTVILNHSGPYPMGSQRQNGRQYLRLLDDPSQGEAGEARILIDNNEGPVTFEGVLATNLKEDQIEVMDPNSTHPVIYSKGLATEQESEFSVDAIQAGFEAQIQYGNSINGNPEAYGTFLEILDNCHLRVTQLVGGDHQVIFDSLADGLTGVPDGTTFNLGDGEVAVLNPTGTNEICGRYTVAANNRISLWGSLIKHSPNTAVALVSFNDNISISAGFKTLQGDLYMNNDSPDDEVTAKVEATVVAPRGKALEMDSLLNSPAIGSMGALEVDGMIVAKEGAYYQLYETVEGTQVRKGFASKTVTHSTGGALQNQFSAPPGVNLAYSQRLQITEVATSNQRYEPVARFREKWGL